MIPTHQSHFHTRWAHLRDPHVRTLAWLLDAPGLLDATATSWAGRVADLGPVIDNTVNWLTALDRNPQPLHAALDIQPMTRLGRYAENLLAYFLREQGRLVAQNIQVRGDRNETVGEFDFLLHESSGNTLLHWEFATKLYLLEASGAGHITDYFIGPGLADTLGAKIRKIMDRQLMLSQHPNAVHVLPRPVARAQALVKGWLFYHGSTPQPTAPIGIAQAHCRGFWCALGELPAVAAERYAILPRLRWLAPARIDASDSLDHALLMRSVERHFASDTTPVLIALLDAKDGALLECNRGFVVPDDWRERAHARSVT